LVAEHLAHLLLEVWLCLELGGQRLSELSISKVLPPVLGEDVLLLAGHFGVLGDNIFCLSACGLPDFTLVVSEVDFLATFTLEVEIEPHQEFSGENDEVGEVVMIDRCVNKDGDFVVSEPNSFLELSEFGQGSLDIVHLNLASGVTQSALNALLLLVEISEALLPLLDLVEDGLNVVSGIS